MAARSRLLLAWLPLLAACDPFVFTTRCEGDGDCPQPLRCEPQRHYCYLPAEATVDGALGAESGRTEGGAADRRPGDGSSVDASGRDLAGEVDGGPGDGGLTDRAAAEASPADTLPDTPFPSDAAGEAGPTVEGGPGPDGAARDRPVRDIQVIAQDGPIGPHDAGVLEIARPDSPFGIDVAAPADGGGQDGGPADAHTGDGSGVDSAYAEGGTDSAHAEGGIDSAYAEGGVDGGHADATAADLVGYDGPCPAGWWDCRWLYRRQVTFPWRQDVAAATLDNFPGLVEIGEDINSRENFVAESLRFVIDAEDSPLPHEVDTWSEFNASVRYIWVQLPARLADGDTLWMYYNRNTMSVDAGLGPGVDPTAVWDTTIYQGVWHWNGASTADTYDSTAGSWDLDLTSVGSLDTRIGEYASFGVDSAAVSNATPSQLENELLISFWIQAKNGTSGHVMTLSDDASAASWALSLTQPSGGRVKLTFDATTVQGTTESAEADLSYQVWTHVLIARSANQGRLDIYVDGGDSSSGSEACRATEAGDGCRLPVRGALYIGVSPDGDPRAAFSLEELRIGSGAVGSTWVKAAQESTAVDDPSFPVSVLKNYQTWPDLL